MRLYPYLDEDFSRLRIYASALPPSPPVSYGLLHPEVQVPRGCLPIKITLHSQPYPIQTECPNPHQSHSWSIFIPTSPVEGLGHHYELVEEPPTYWNSKSTFYSYNSRWRQAHGSHTVGYVAPNMLPHLETHFARVPMLTLGGSLHSQYWVYYVLQGLNHPHMFTVKVTWEDLSAQMAIVSYRWEMDMTNLTREANPPGEVKVG